MFFADPILQRYQALLYRRIKNRFGPATAKMNSNDLRFKYTYLSDLVGNIPTKYLPQQKYALVTPTDLLFDCQLFQSFRMDANWEPMSLEQQKRTCSENEEKT